MIVCFTNLIFNDVTKHFFWIMGFNDVLTMFCLFYYFLSWIVILKVFVRFLNPLWVRDFEANKFLVRLRAKLRRMRSNSKIWCTQSSKNSIIYWNIPDCLAESIKHSFNSPQTTYIPSILQKFAYEYKLYT